VVNAIIYITGASYKHVSDSSDTFYCKITSVNIVVRVGTFETNSM